MKLTNPNEKIFIAGHNGMVGSAIYKALNRKGCNNLLTANRKDLDLSDILAVNKWFDKYRPTITILAAAKVGGILANNSYPVEFLLENLKIQNNVIETSWRKGVKRLLFLGSSCIYPKFASQPIREEALMSGALEGTNESYAIAKIAGIQLCKALRTQYGFDAISLMPTNLYGPGDNYHPKNSHVLPALISKFYNAKVNHLNSVHCWGSGEPRREFLHVDDLADAAIFAIENWNPKKRQSLHDQTNEELLFLNVGTGKDITIKELAELIAAKLNYQGEILWDSNQPNGTPRKLLDVSRLKALGWESKIRLETGIENTILDFKDNAHRYLA